jgi:hypothetical protein
VNLPVVVAVATSSIVVESRGKDAEFEFCHEIETLSTWK